MFTVTNNGYIHGPSVIVELRTVEFFSWKRNEESGEYWIKLHVPSGKEIRIRANEGNLRTIVREWERYGGQAFDNMLLPTEIELKIGEKYELDY